MLAPQYVDQIVTNTASRNASGHLKLKAAWDLKKAELGKKLTQEKAAADMGFSSQGTVADYLRGRIPLNLSAAMRFARYLGVPLTEIWDGDAELAFVNLPLEDVEQIALSLSHEDQLVLARILLENSTPRKSER